MATAFRAATTAFRESYLYADAPKALAFGHVDARRLRYDLLWATYENSVYRDIHQFARKYRADLGLYKYTRGVHSPAFRLGEFYATHIWGGPLDADAGDGTPVPSALPILTDNAALRPAIAALWRASNLAQRKGIAPRWGAVLGDVAIKVVDDARRERIYLQFLHPSTLREVVRDEFGNVKGYVQEEIRRDPREAGVRLVTTPSRDPRTVTYQEIVYRDGDAVVYETYLDGQPYNWSDDPDAPAAWAQPYGFVPLVMVQHLDVGMDWGWSELHAGLPKFREVDDLASKLDDQVRKSVDAPWFFTGMTKPAVAPSLTSTDPTLARPQPGREEIPSLYATTPDARAYPLVAPLDIAAVSERIDRVIAELREDYPELMNDPGAAAGDASGRALRVARQRTTTRAIERRTNYDAALVRAQQMAIAIGGFAGYAGYQSFGLDSYASGALDHAIGERPVFAADPLDATEIDAAMWGAAKAAKEAGYELRLFLEDQGWAEEKLRRLDDYTAERRAMAQAIAAPPQAPTIPTPANTPQEGAAGTDTTPPMEMTP